MTNERVWIHGTIGSPDDVDRVRERLHGIDVVLSRVVTLDGVVTAPFDASSRDSLHGLQVHPTSQVTWRVEGDRGVVTVISDTAIDGLETDEVEVLPTSTHEAAWHGPESPPVRYRTLRSTDGQPLGVRVLPATEGDA